jgi:hypothetical protein
MKILPFLTLMVLSTSLINPASAQEPHHARISIVHPGVDSLTGDLKSMIDLTDKKEQETWVDLKDYFDLLGIGVDGSRLIRVDVLTGLTPVCYLVWVPLAGEGKSLADDFRENLDAFGYMTRRDPRDRSLYEIEQEPEYGWLRVMPDIKYGVFVITEGEKDLALLKQLVLKAGDPHPDVATLTALTPSVAAELVNTAITEEDQAKRRKSSEELRKISMDALQQRPDESESGFGLRQSALDIQLDEAERLMAESEALRVWATYDREKHTAAVNFTAVAIDGTVMQNSIQQFGTNPDVFAAIPKAENSALSGRLNHPIDEMRQANAVEFVGLVEARISERITSSDNLSVDEKAAAKELLEGIVEIVQDTARSGYANAFIESIPDGNKDFSTVTGIAVPNADRVNDLIPLFAKADKDNVGEAGVDSVGGFTIHRVRLAAGSVGFIDRFFGEESDLFIGVSESQVWMASGENALELLKSTIASLGEAETHNTAIHVDVRLLKWVERLDAVVSAEPEPESLEDKEAWRDAKRQRTRAIAALQTDDLLTVEVTSEDDVVSGMATIGLGSMRFVGKMIAAFTKENLQ